MLNLNSIMIGSENPKQLADFYGKVLQKKPDMDENGFTGYLAGNTFISIGQHDAVKGKSTNPERMIFFFETKDVQGEFERVSKIDGATAVKEPYSPDDTGKFMLATLSDPDGNYFQLSSPWDA